MAFNETSIRKDAGHPKIGNFPDVLVVGGGIAGSTISALLVEDNCNVVLLEKSYYPRQYWRIPTIFELADDSSIWVLKAD